MQKPETDIPGDQKLQQVPWLFQDAEPFDLVLLMLQFLLEVGYQPLAFEWPTIP